MQKESKSDSSDILDTCMSAVDCYNNCFPYFPDTIPAHYNASDLVDRYGSKNAKIINASKISVIVIVNIIDYALLMLVYNTIRA